MKTCNFEKLVHFLDEQLELDEKLDVLDHLDSCDICRDAIYHISRDRDSGLFEYRPYKPEKILAG
jgi:uncharacterized protein YuzB (UPF0349 family)